MAESATEPVDRRGAVEGQIIAAAHGLLDDGQSFTSLKVSDITERAGIGRTAFYFYFRDKRELLLRMASDIAEELYRRADRWWHGSGDGAESLRAQVGSVIDMFLDNGPLMRALLDASASDPTVRAFRLELGERFIAATAERISRERDSGQAPAVPERETAASLVWMVEWSCYHASLDPDVDRDRFIEAIGGIWLRSLYGEGPAG